MDLSRDSHEAEVLAKYIYSAAIQAARDTHEGLHRRVHGAFATGTRRIRSVHGVLLETGALDSQPGRKSERAERGKADRAQLESIARSQSLPRRFCAVFSRFSL